MAKGSTEAGMTEADLLWSRMLWRLERVVKQEACDFIRRAAKDLRPSTRAKALRGPPTEQQAECPHPWSRRFRGANQYAEYEICRLCQLRIRYKERNPKEWGLVAAPDQQGSQLRATWRPPRLACRADAASSCASPAGPVTADCADDWGDAQVAASATSDHSRVDHGHSDFA